MDSKLWIPHSKYWIPVFDIGTWESGFQSLVGFRILLHYSGFHKQKFPECWNSLFGAIRGGGSYPAGLITFHNKLHSTADQNTCWIQSRFYASKRRKKSIQYKLEGGLCSAGLITRCTFSLQVDRGLISGAGGGGWGVGHINGRLRYSATGRWGRGVRTLQPMLVTRIEPNADVRLWKDLH